MDDILVEIIRGVEPGVTDDTVLLQFLRVHHGGNYSFVVPPYLDADGRIKGAGDYYARRRADAETGLILVDIYKREAGNE